MKEGRPLSLEEIRGFLTASEELRFESQNRQQMYAFVRKTLVGQTLSFIGERGQGLGAELYL